MAGRLVTISGYATSGKDAVADILVKELGWYKTYMSKPLEQALLTLNPWVPWHSLGVSRGDISKAEYWIRYQELHARVGYDESKKNPEVRRLLQTLGTEIGRKMFGEDTWLNLVGNEASSQIALGRDVVVTGVRYPNELRRFQELKTLAVWVQRPGVEAVNDHSSEHALPPMAFDTQINNDGTLDDLRKVVIKKFEPFS